MTNTNQPYTYFIAYTHPTGTGNVSLSRAKPITTWDHVQEVIELIRNHCDVAWASITTYQLLSGPDTVPEVDVEVVEHQLQSAIGYGEQFLAGDGDLALVHNMVAFAKRALITLHQAQ